MAGEAGGPGVVRSSAKSVSLVLPMFNEAAGVDHTLGTALAALEAAFEDFEIVVADDASTDDSAARVGRLARWAVFGPAGANARRALRREGLGTADRTLGVLSPGRITEAALLAHLARLPDGLTEIGFHAATHTSPALARVQPGYEHAGELAALCSPAVRETIERRGIRLVDYRDA